MSSKRSLVMASILAGTVAGSLAETASAQVVRGKFRLPYDVRWGLTVLPAGEYSISVPSVSLPASIYSATGKHVAFLPFTSIDPAIDGRPTSLLITRFENERVVRVFNWREGGRAFVYRPFTKAERARLAKSGETETVPILMAAR